MSRTIVVTGAGSGIGACVRERYLKEGDLVIGVDLRGADIEADLSTPEGRAAAVAAVTETVGPDGAVDALITCAGLSVDKEVTVRVNYFGTTEVVAGLRPLLAASPAPRVVLIGSIAGGAHPNDPAVIDACLSGDETAAVAAARAAVEAGSGYVLYPSSKNAVAQWARRTAVSAGWADAGIAVNVVAPGIVLTPMSAELFADAQMKELMDAAVPMPLHGYAAADDVARVVCFLADAATTHVTGQVLYVDGGAETTLRPTTQF
ncbi:SDR family oxidoreductase [Nocardioides sp. GY 10113]|uniref:SDR family oxidoreductase n=1 Tax=Nocardioides sp. GY 10113 TaxID=2569761 RepID=UPI0010A89216|nr:SDR family oxidoreductase [Nocardioides sp. GY 10113]TIC85114.1 SDR family oxidoreductase [Nocardioides sp. GY 10113]